MRTVVLLVVLVAGSGLALGARVEIECLATVGA